MAWANPQHNRIQVDRAGKVSIDPDATSPTPAKDLLAEFRRLEKEAEKMLEGLAQ